jgi:dolichol-phosphate mannosyltransferase
VKIRSALVIVPTYDERDNLPGIIDRALAAIPDQVHVLVVDDNSPDGTGEVAEEIALYRPRVHVLHRQAKSGLGPAYLAGFSWAIEQGFDAVVEMDADGSHAPEDLPRLIAGLETHEIVLGSRWVPGGRVENWPLHRELLSRGGNAYARMVLGIRVRDATGGFRAIRVEVLQRIAIAGIASQGYCFQIDLLWRALVAGTSVLEIPITFSERAQGRSKMSGRIVVEALFRVTQWGIARRLRARDQVTNHSGGPSVPATPST